MNILQSKWHQLLKVPILGLRRSKMSTFVQDAPHHENAFTKGQLISKCPFGVIVSTKIPTKKFDKFCPTHSRAEFVKFFRW